MRHLKSICLAACLVAGAMTTVNLFAADPKADPNQTRTAQPATQPAGIPDMQAMMKAWEAYATPGPEHAELAKLEGEWDAVMEDLSPGVEGQKSALTSSAKMIFGGRYLKEEVKGTSMGMPFEGLSIVSFDNQTKQYTSLWIDSMGTGVTKATGTMQGDKLVLDGEMICPGIEKPVDVHEEMTSSDADHRVLDMKMTTKDGQPLGAMRITYTRKK